MRYPTPALWRCRLVRVLDGDTVDVLVDRGFEDQTTMTIRLQAVHAPERSQPGGLETRDFVLGWFTDHDDGSVWPWLLETFRTPRSDVEVETLGRYVGRISGPGGVVLNDDVQAFVLAAGYPPGS